MSDSLRPLDCSPPDSSVRGILQAWILEWVDIPFSRESAQPSLPHCRQILYLLSHQLKHTKKTIHMKIQVSVSDPTGRSWLRSDLRRDRKPSKGKGACSLFPAFCLACWGPRPAPAPSLCCLRLCVCISPGPALFFSCYADHICFSGCTCPNIATLAQFSRSLVQEIEWALKTFSHQSCPTLCDPMNHSSPGLPVDHQLPDFTQTHVPSSRWCHPAISSSVVPFSCPQSLPASGSFPISQLFAWSGHSIRVSASASVLPMNTQDWPPLGWPGWISLQPKGLSKSLLQHDSSKPSSFRHSAFFTVQLSHPYMTTGKTIALTRRTFVGKVMSVLFNMLSRLVTTFLPRLNPNSEFPGGSALVCHRAGHIQDSSVVTASSLWQGGEEIGFLTAKGIDYCFRNFNPHPTNLYAIPLWVFFSPLPRKSVVTTHDMTS